MKFLKSFISEKLILNKNSKQSGILKYSEIINEIQKNLGGLGYNTNYIMINVVREKYKDPTSDEWLQLSFGAYKDKNNTETIMQSVKTTLDKDFKLKNKYNISFKLGDSFSLINVRFEDKFIDDTD